MTLRLFLKLLFSFLSKAMDVDDPAEPSAPILGRVLLFTNRSQDAPYMSMKHAVGTGLSSVLNALGNCFSPIRSKNLSTPLFFYNNHFQTQKSRFL